MLVGQPAEQRASARADTARAPRRDRRRPPLPDLSPRSAIVIVACIRTPASEKRERHASRSTSPCVARQLVDTPQARLLALAERVPDILPQIGAGRARRAPARSRPQRSRRTPRRPASRACGQRVDAVGRSQRSRPAGPERPDERQPGHRGPLLAEIDLLDARRLVIEEQRGSPMRSAASQRRSIVAGSGAIGTNSGSMPKRSQHRIRSSAFDVRELVSAAIVRISLQRLGA